MQQALPFQVSCKVCGVQVRPNYLAEHVREMHNRTEPAACFVPQCSSSFRSISGLRKHLRQCHYACAVCKSDYGTPTELKYHVKKVHLLKKFVCSVCVEHFRTAGALLDHVMQCKMPVPALVEEDQLN
jgi:hypothetical protein